ncbi:hypothetical protein R3P38DRAFT_228492 [Favolaschia claudopus]|uniref:RRM domain-containing protein n=1 Tax=Favolaschia claudopus TaxID=2862362 RepID=A0AAV9ZSS7_9AGAR
MTDYAPYAFKAPQHQYGHAYQPNYGYRSAAEPGPENGGGGSQMMNNTATSARQYLSPPPPTTTTTTPGPATPSSTSSTSSSTLTMTSTIAPPTSLLWTDLEPWMDAEYARQVCALMRWDAVVAVPAPLNPSTSNNGGVTNNAGYCVLTFGSAAGAASALTQVNSPMGAQMTMPNSARPFVLNWAPPGVAAHQIPMPPSHPHPHPQAHGHSHTPSTSNAPPPHVTSPPPPSNSALSLPPSSSSSATNNNGYNPSAANGADPNGPAQSTSPASPLSPTNAVSGMHGPNGVVSAMGVAMGAGGLGAGGGGSPYPREYSIFVGDLAPETSNSDLVAVFRNPVLGLRNDRAPKFIRPFLSCKSAKIMLDPVTGVSRGYGFVRFTDEADQQRALIEMHGLYCLSRPMRISPATAKFKPPPHAELPASASAPGGYPSGSLPASVSAEQQQHHQQQQQQHQPPPPSVSAPIAGYFANGEPAAGSGYPPPPGLPASASAEYFVPGPNNNNNNTNNNGGPDEWRHTAQARAILGNLIGPNGEQLTSTDPYNTTVFVGGLSPLVGEDTLRTFFVPFGEIHYVKVPVGKHCGFVQFVRKADAERAIEKMQGFPVGGSRIRLSWGRSQYKAAQAAAQAAQAAALAQAQVQTHSHIPVVQPPPPSMPHAQHQQHHQQHQHQPMPIVAQQQQVSPSAAAALNGGLTPAMLEGMTHEQAVALLQKFQLQGISAFISAPPPPPAMVNGGYAPAGAGVNGAGNGNGNGGAPVPEAYRNGYHAPSPSAGEAAHGVNGGSNGQQQHPQQQQQQQPHFTDESRKMRRGGEEGPFGYAQRGAYEVVPPSSSSAPTSSFSPFSPDPNQHGQQQQQSQSQQQQQQPAQQQGQAIGGLYAAAELLGKRRDSYAGMMPPYGGVQHSNKGYGGPGGFFPVQPTIQTSGAIPINGGGKVGSGSGSPTRGGYAGSPPAFQVNRYSGPPPISRPGSGAARVERIGNGNGGEELLFDPMHDLNGTLASLDLGLGLGGERERERGEYAWGLKSPTVTESTSAESTSSGGSVQFRMSMESP